MPIKLDLKNKILNIHNFEFLKFIKVNLIKIAVVIEVIGDRKTIKFNPEINFWKILIQDLYKHLLK